jgi:hypothetical protein
LPSRGGSGLLVGRPFLAVLAMATRRSPPDAATREVMSAGRVPARAALVADESVGVASSRSTALMRSNSSRASQAQLRLASVIGWRMPFRARVAIASLTACLGPSTGDAAAGSSAHRFGRDAV